MGDRIYLLLSFLRIIISFSSEVISESRIGAAAPFGATAAMSRVRGTAIDDCDMGYRHCTPVTLRN